MADPSPSPEPGAAPDRATVPTYPGTPRWVKTWAIIFVGLVLLVIGVLVVTTVLGLHTPGGPGGHGL